MSLIEDTELRVYAIGEIKADGPWDYGWIEDRSTGRTGWTMAEGEWEHAGGTTSNRLVDTVTQLPAGEYSLHYTTDDSHAYMTWNADAPDHLFWGIRVLLRRN